MCTAADMAWNLDALGAALMAHPNCGKVMNNVSLALEHMHERLHPEDLATTRRAASALEEARRCWPGK